MALVIPCRTDLTHYDMDVVLDGATFNLEFRWNTREQSWYVSLRAEDLTPLWLGKKVALGALIGARSRAAGRPPGFFVARDTSNSGAPPGQKELGSRVEFAYVTGAEADGLA